MTKYSLCRACQWRNIDERPRQRLHEHLFYNLYDISSNIKQVIASTSWKYLCSHGLKTRMCMTSQELGSLYHHWITEIVPKRECRLEWSNFMGQDCRIISYHAYHGPLARYVKFWVAHAPGMPGTFSPPPRVSDPDMHHDTCVTHVPWCMPGSLTNGFLWSRSRGKRSWHSQRMRNPQLYVSGKKSIYLSFRLLTQQNK